MDRDRRAFLESLLETSTPSGFESAGQRVWVEYVDAFADDVETDEYGNAVAVVRGGSTELALAGHGDEIGFMVRSISDDGFVRLTRIGGADRTVSQGQHVRIHADGGPVPGVIGQTAIHLRDSDSESLQDVEEQFVDIGAADQEEAEGLVERGDPVTFVQSVSELQNGRLAARGMDNRIGIWAAAEALRQVAKSDVDATVYAVSTVQEEVGLQGAKMVGFDLNPDAAIAVDVTHALDTPESPATRQTDVALGAGPVVARGSSNHPELVTSVRSAADRADIDVQLQASGNATRTDADAFFTSRSGIPSLYIGVPNRYMHTPVEIVDVDDLTETAALLAETARQAHDLPFGG